jgi:hypothetical protein
VIRTLTTLLAVAALVAVVSPVALAGSTHPNDRAGRLGPGAVTQPDSAVAPSGRPDGRDLPAGPDRAADVPAVIVRSVPDDGFDWSSALLGAAGAAGIALALAGSLALRSRTPSAAR